MTDRKKGFVVAVPAYDPYADPIGFVIAEVRQTSKWGGLYTTVEPLLRVTTWKEAEREAKAVRARLAKYEKARAREVAAWHARRNKGGKKGQRKAARRPSVSSRRAKS